MHTHFLRGPGQDRVLGSYDYMYILSQRKPCRGTHYNLVYMSTCIYSNNFAMKTPTVRNLIAVSPNSLSFRTCLHVGYFFMLLLPSPDFFKIDFIKLFQEHFQSVKRFESISRPTFC